MSDLRRALVELVEAVEHDRDGGRRSLGVDLALDQARAALDHQQSQLDGLRVETGGGVAHVLADTARRFGIDEGDALTRARMSLVENAVDEDDARELLRAADERVRRTCTYEED